MRHLAESLLKAGHTADPVREGSLVDRRDIVAATGRGTVGSVGVGIDLVAHLAVERPIEDGVS